MANYKLDTTARYAKTHEWVRMEDGVAVVGISDAAQDMISDVVYVELPQENADVKAGAHVADIESVKAAYEIFAPVTGKIIGQSGPGGDAGTRQREAVRDVVLQNCAER